MDWWETGCEWCRLHRVVERRARLLHWVVGDAVTLSGRAGRYSLTLWGREVAAWRAYDLPSVRCAVEVSGALFGALWDARRLGHLVGCEESVAAL